jgi:hypothetical protein
MVYSFCALAACADGANPNAGLVQDTSGVLYGTTPNGGANNTGSVYSCRGRIPPPSLLL